MVDTAQNVGGKFHMTRQECDGFALRSHELADAAWNRGFYDESVMEVSVPPAQRRPHPHQAGRDHPSGDHDGILRTTNSRCIPR